MTWNEMDSAPKDGTVIEILSLNYGKPGHGVSIYRARWAKKARKWLNWADLNEELLYGRKWRMPVDLVQPRQFTDEEEAVLARLHRADGTRFIPFKEFATG